MHFISFCSRPLMPADITQQQISLGGISKTKPPASLTRQELSEPLSLELLMAQLQEGAQENLIHPVLNRNSCIPPLSPGWCQIPGVVYTAL